MIKKVFHLSDSSTAGGDLGKGGGFDLIFPRLRATAFEAFSGGATSTTTITPRRRGTTSG